VCSGGSPFGLIVEDAPPKILFDELEDRLPDRQVRTQVADPGSVLRRDDHGCEFRKI
jgi:hypothetical protein